MGIPRVVVAALGSSAGKTTVAAGLMGALSGTGLKVQGFKVGPDFIDPTYHSAATGRKSRNLDAWMLPTRRILELFYQNASDSDIAIIEGVMGLYDGLSGTERIGSTAQLAKLLKAPVVLVLDVQRMAGSAAAVVAGCKVLDRKLEIAAVILNKVSGERHAEMCTEAIESATRIPVIGTLPTNPEVALPERHLGLIPTTEAPDLIEKLSRVSEFVRSNVSLERVVDIAKKAPPLKITPPRTTRYKHKISIGVASDEAFTFYYQDALDSLRSLGAEVTYFSPLHDTAIPDELSGLYIGGGFPEVLANKLEGNNSIRNSIREKAEDGMPILAECGGLMYLTNSIIDFEGKSHSMVGLLECETQMTKKLTLNYTDALVTTDNFLAKSGSNIRGHEFHFSKLNGIPSDARFVYEMRRGLGIDRGKDGWIQYSVLAQYMHMHLAASLKYSSNFIRACADYSRK